MQEVMKKLDHIKTPFLGAGGWGEGWGAPAGPYVLLPPLSLSTKQREERGPSLPFRIQHQPRHGGRRSVDKTTSLSRGELNESTNC